MAIRHPLECHTAPHRAMICAALEDAWPFASVLDVGCATGSMLDEIRGRWPAVILYGLDLDISLLRKNHYHRFVAELPCGLACVRSTSVDVVMAFSVLELFSHAARGIIQEDMHRIARRAVIIGGISAGVWRLTREMVA